MVNKEYVQNDKIKDILKYIKGLKHSEMLRMMFFCSLNGMRCINFRCLQLKDVIDSNGKAKDVIDLPALKNKGKMGAQYYVNHQFKAEIETYYRYMKEKYGEKLNEESFLFASQKTKRPFNRVSICRIFHNIYKTFGIHGASHLGRHLFITNIANAGVSVFVTRLLANHKNLSTTQKYFNSTTPQLLTAVENASI